MSLPVAFFIDLNQGRENIPAPPYEGVWPKPHKLRRENEWSATGSQSSAFGGDARKKRQRKDMSGSYSPGNIKIVLRPGSSRCPPPRPAACQRARGLAMSVRWDALGGSDFGHRYSEVVQSGQGIRLYTAGRRINRRLRPHIGCSAFGSLRTAGRPESQLRDRSGSAVGKVFR